MLRILDQECRSAASPAPNAMFNSRLTLPLIGADAHSDDLVLELWSERGRRKGCVLCQRRLTIADAHVLARRAQCWLVCLPPRDGCTDAEPVAELVVSIEPPAGSSLYRDGAAELTANDWFWPACSATDAYAALAPLAAGAFLVRPSSKVADACVVSYKDAAGNVKHVTVERRDGCWCPEGSQRTFATMSEMIERYQAARVYSTPCKRPT